MTLKSLEEQKLQLEHAVALATLRLHELTWKLGGIVKAIAESKRR
jgi:hypothetical protein